MMITGDKEDPTAKKSSYKFYRRKKLPPSAPTVITKAVPDPKDGPAKNLPPSCLNEVLHRVFTSDDARPMREVNTKLMSSLFLGRIDLEEVNAVVQPDYVAIDAKGETSSNPPHQNRFFPSDSGSSKFRKMDFFDSAYPPKKPKSKPKEDTYDDMKHRRPIPNVTYIKGLNDKMYETMNYFGEDARNDFFARYRQMSNSRFSISTTNGAPVPEYLRTPGGTRVSTAMDSSYGDSVDGFEENTLETAETAESDVTMITKSTSHLTGDYLRADRAVTASSQGGRSRKTVSIAPLKLDENASVANSVDQSRSAVSKLSLTMGESSMESSQNSQNYYVANALNRPCEDFYTELQGYVSQDGASRSIDQTIFQYNSFDNYREVSSQSAKNYATGASKRLRKKQTRMLPVGGVLAPLEAVPGTTSGSRSALSTARSRSSLDVSRPPTPLDGDTPLTTAPSTADSHSTARSSPSKHDSSRMGAGFAGQQTDSTAMSVSPRTKYISGCLREGLCPLANLVLRKDFTTGINLSHYGLGDKMGIVLSECLQELPLIESLNLADNNLTDDSLQYLIVSIISIKALTHLDLSRNKIDGLSSDALADYVARDDCPLRTLILQSADVDDGECDRFVQCLVTNQKLLELDLSNNLLGSAEGSKTEDELTGGESLAVYLVSKQCRLQTLKLSWNAIRLDSAVKLCSAVAHNNTLTFLDISCNGLGWAAGETLGDALMENRTLETLHASNNNFTSSSVMSLCIGIVENLAMKYINLNENPIGEAGVKAIMQLAITVGNRCTISAANCNTIALDERCWYDPGLPCKEYLLELEKPFDRAVAFHLLQTVASHSTYVFSRSIYEFGEGRATKQQPLKLVQSFATDREKFFDEEQKALLHGLRVLFDAASDVELGTRLFYEADEDESGKLDKDELKIVLDKIGLELDEERLQDIFAVFDIDGAGVLDLPEFLSLLKSQKHESNCRIKDLTQYPMMSLKENKKMKYVPPRTGRLHLKVIDGFVRKSEFYTLTSIDTKNANKQARAMGDVTLMAEVSRNSKMRYNEAYNMFKTMYKELGDKAQVLVKIIPGMMMPSESRMLVSKVTNDDRVQLARIKLAFGVAYQPMFGSYNGYYALDFSKELHRICFQRLLEQSQTMNGLRARESIIAIGRVGDTSQNQNWSSFRNGNWQGMPNVITPKQFTPMPHSGHLNFDFSGGNRPVGGELVLTDKRLCKVLQNICLLTLDYQYETMQKLDRWRELAVVKAKRDPELHMPIYAPNIRVCFEIGKATDVFYDELEDRQELTRIGAKKEEIKLDFMAEGAQAEAGTDDSRPATADTEGGGDAGDDDASLGSRGTHGTQESGAMYRLGDADTSLPGNENIGFDDFDGQGECESPSFGATNNDLASDSGRASRQNFLDNISGNDQIYQTAMENYDNDLEDRCSTADSRKGEQPSTSVDDNSSITSYATLSNDVQLMLRQQKIAILKKRLETLLAAQKGVSMHAKASRFIEVIEETFCQLWVRSRHLAIIVTLFRKLFGTIGRSTAFGSYLVDIVVAMFARVIDLHCFEIVLEVLEPAEVAAVYCRLGILNVFNPMKPETSLELNLDRGEDRVLAKIIVLLSADEPGINLTYKQFQWKRELEPTPGWDVSESWLTEEGMATHGYFAFTYYSGEGLRKHRCVPNIQLRKALCHLCLIDENEIYDEDASPPEDYVKTAAKHYEENQDVWSLYLVPGCDTFG